MTKPDSATTMKTKLEQLAKILPHVKGENLIRLDDGDLGDIGSTILDRGIKEIFVANKRQKISQTNFDRPRLNYSIKTEQPKPALNYECAVGSELLFQFWDKGWNPINGVISILAKIDNGFRFPFYAATSNFSFCRPSTRIQEFPKDGVGVLPSGFVWEIDCVDGSYAHNFSNINKHQIKNHLQAERIIGIKCIGLASNYAHLADELGMEVIEGVGCDS